MAGDDGLEALSVIISGLTDSVSTDRLGVQFESEGSNERFHRTGCGGNCAIDTTALLASDTSSLKA